MTRNVRSASTLVRILFGFFGVAAVALFLLIFVVGQLGGSPPIHGAIFAGVMPATLAVYFWLCRREQRAFTMGIAAVLAAIAIHYVVAILMAHGDGLVP